MAATMKDLALETGLGLATISSYFNGGNVRPKNREKIEAAIEALHYEVNETARGLKSNSTRTIGILIPQLGNVFCAEIITEIEEIFRENGYATLICDCQNDSKREKEAADFLFHRRVDGIINMAVDESGNHLQCFTDAGKPVVLIDRTNDAEGCTAVLVDNRNAGLEATCHLIREGHRKIGIIAGPSDVFTGRERLKGYMEALEKAGIVPEENLIWQGDYTIESGIQGFENLVRKNPEMSAVFATNYEMTVGAVIGAHGMNISIPEQISLVGFDNLSFAKACSPDLTIVTQPTREIAAYAARQMLICLGKQSGTLDGPVMLRTKLVEGHSVKALQN